MRHVSLLLMLAAAVPACAPNSNGNGDDDDDGNGFVDGGGIAIDSGPGFIDAGGINEGPDAGSSSGACDKMDILFVIDNSGSMEEEQTNLATNFPQFVQVIENYVTSVGTHLDYHLAITTTDKSITTTAFGQTIGTTPGNDGKFVTGSGCNFPAGRKYLQKGDPNVSAAFSCAAKVGIEGSPDEMPLETAKLALIDRMTGAGATNAGFLRDDALLAIVLLTDENDCSTPISTFDIISPVDCVGLNGLEPPANYLTKFDSVKGGERGRWAVAVIAGPGPGVCESPFGAADEATRLKSFTTGVGQNAVFTSICEGNLAHSLEDAFETFGVACENIPPID